MNIKVVNIKRDGVMKSNFIKTILITGSMSGKCLKEKVIYVFGMFRTESPKQTKTK